MSEPTFALTATSGRTHVAGATLRHTLCGKTLTGELQAPGGTRPTCKTCLHLLGRIQEES